MFVDASAMVGILASEEDADELSTRLSQADRIHTSAFERFGRGRHPAQLNLGDCFAYACARALDIPLLFKGDDFARTRPHGHCFRLSASAG